MQFKVFVLPRCGSNSSGSLVILKLCRYSWKKKLLVNKNIASNMNALQLYVISAFTNNVDIYN